MHLPIRLLNNCAIAILLAQINDSAMARPPMPRLTIPKNRLSPPHWQDFVKQSRNFIRNNQNRIKLTVVLVIALRMPRAVSSCVEID